MASFASLASLGSACSCSSSQLEGSRSLVNRVSITNYSCDFHRLLVGQKWRFASICKYSVTSNVTLDQGTSVSPALAYKVSKDDDKDLTLKPAPKPVLRAPVLRPPQPKIEPISGVNNIPKRPGGRANGGKSNDEEERKEVIGSLGEVLEKAEKLETSNNVIVPNKKATTLSTSKNTYQRNGRPTKSAPVGQSNSSKKIWRKGNPVTPLQEVLKKSPDIKEVQEEKPITEVTEIGNQVVAPLRPAQPPLRVEPKLQGKPSIAPPPIIKKPTILKDVGAIPSAAASPPNIKKPTILKDVGAIPSAAASPPNIKKRTILKDVGAATKTHDTVETDSGIKKKEHSGPILIDKFAFKQAEFDPLIDEDVSAPRRPRKSSAPEKFRDDFEKKNGASGGRKRMDADDDIHDEELIGRNVGARRQRKWSKASRRAARLQAAWEARPVKVEILEVGEDGMLTEELAYNLAVSQGEILGSLFIKGVRTDGAQKLDKEMVKMICKEYDVEVIEADPTKITEMAKKKEILDEQDLDNLQDRPPVITIMGHVDHGKTTLLDYIRKTKVAASEAGGITQGIGAYRVQVPIDGDLRPCVFLDTPGHEAFGAMRARGARVTDIAIIVVAADDGIRPQTNEAVAHAKAAGVPIIIAINKVDKIGPDPEEVSKRVIQVMDELNSIGVQPEDWGGDVPMIQISALKGENVDDLLETTMLVAELQELQANPDRNAKGTVIEAGLDKSKGPVATFIVQNGTLKRGDIVVCGEAFGKVRGLFDDGGKQVNEAGPSMPVQMIGLNKVPIAGDEFEVVSSLDVAQERAEERALALRDELMLAKAGDGKITLSSFASSVSSRRGSGLDLHQLNIILKVDVQGSTEAVRQVLQKLPQDNVTLKFILQATGDVSNSDVDLAVASEAIIFGFNVKASGSVKRYADDKGVEIRLYKVIYELLDDVRSAMEGLLDPVEEQVPLGAAEVRAVFSSGSNLVAGCMVNEGKVAKDCGVRVLRKGETIFVGNLDSLRRIKADVKEVNAGLECGIGVDDFNEWEMGDIIETFTKVQKRRTLEDASAQMAAAREELESKELELIKSEET